MAVILCIISVWKQTFKKKQQLVTKKNPASCFLKIFSNSMQHRPSRYVKDVFSQSNSPHFMGPEGSLLDSQEPTTCLYSELHQYLTNFKITLPSMPGSSQWYLSLRFPPLKPFKHLSSLPRATCPTDLILLDLITQIILVRSKDH